jgi:hypothetical protein
MAKEDSDILMPEEEPTRETAWWQDPYNRGLLVTAAGIMATFLVYGIIQEKLMTTPYGMYSTVEAEELTLWKDRKDKCSETRPFWC